MSLLKDLADYYLIQKRNPFHDELGRFSSGGNAVTTSRGEKFKTARSNYAKVRREAKNSPDRVERLRNEMEAKKPKEAPKPRKVYPDYFNKSVKDKKTLDRLDKAISESIPQKNRDFDLKTWEKNGNTRVYLNQRGEWKRGKFVPSYNNYGYLKLNNDKVEIWDSPFTKEQDAEIERKLNIAIFEG